MGLCCSDAPGNIYLARSALLNGKYNPPPAGRGLPIVALDLRALLDKEWGAGWRSTQTNGPKEHVLRSRPFGANFTVDQDCCFTDITRFTGCVEVHTALRYCLPTSGLQARDELYFSAEQFQSLESILASTSNKTPATPLLEASAPLPPPPAYADIAQPAQKKAPASWLSYFWFF